MIQKLVKYEIVCDRCKRFAHTIEQPEGHKIVLPEGWTREARRDERFEQDTRHYIVDLCGGCSE